MIIYYTTVPETRIPLVPINPPPTERSRSSSMPLSPDSGVDASEHTASAGSRNRLPSQMSLDANDICRSGGNSQDKNRMSDQPDLSSPQN